MAQWSWKVCFLGAIVLGGVGACKLNRELIFDDDCHHYQLTATQIEYPNTEIDQSWKGLESLRPRSVRNQGPTDIWSLTLEEVVHITLSNSEVIRDIGGTVLSSPTTSASVYDLALSETDVLTGPEAALSAFDTQFSTNLFFDQNERTFNNFFFGGGTESLKENLGFFQAAMSKTAATGTQFSVRNITDYNRNNISIPPNRFHHSWNTVFEAEARQPLLQGAGIDFNRIAGPQAQPGVYNGVVLGRINTDVTLADFERGVRDLLSDVEQTYWQLYFAYRDLDAKVAARDAALETWRAVEGRREMGMAGADAEREALVREQYFSTVVGVENALSGTLTSGLVVITSGGVYTVERQLRYLMGLPSNDGRLIRPADEPSMAEVVFDWDKSVWDALTRRVELRKQKWIVKRRELELVASRSFLRMNLDVIGQYSWRGFGNDLLGRTAMKNASAFQDLFDGDLQEWQLGVELSTPIGNRIGHTATRNAQLNVIREKAVYRQQEQQVVREVSTAFAELDRAYNVSRANYNRSTAAHQQLAALRAKYEVGTVLLEFVIDAQRRATEAASAYYRSLVDYNLAIMNVNMTRGTLLDSMQVYLTEGPWSPKAYRSAARTGRTFRRKHIDYCHTLPTPVSCGPYSQRTMELPERYHNEAEGIPDGELVFPPEAP